MTDSPLSAPVPRVAQARPPAPPSLGGGLHQLAQSEALYPALHRLVPGMSDDELGAAYEQSHALGQQDWLFRAHLLWEAWDRQQRRGTPRDGAVGAVARRFGITRGYASQLIQIWDALRAKFTAVNFAAPLPMRTYRVAAYSDDPVAWANHAEEEHAASGRYTSLDLANDIRRDSQLFDEPSPAAYVCRCGEGFDGRVWHCLGCDHHWPPEQDACPACQGQAAGHIPPKASHQLINASAENEWYTPRPYLDAAHEVMGGVDLDPASTERANRVVRAARYFTIDDDGLAQPWAGRVWLNPPYGRDEAASNQARWSRRLLEEYETGRVTEAILLVNAATGNHWFAPLKRYPICFPDGRIRFATAAGEGRQPTHSNALVYLGPQVGRFADIFGRFGAVLATRGVWEAHRGTTR